MKKILSLLTLLSLLNISLSYASFEEEILSLNGTSSHIDGPNCWNAALKVKGVLPHFRQTLPEEWLYLLGEYCEEKQIPSYGDIGRVVDKSGNEVHGFIYLEEDFIFQKLGEDKQHGYQVVTMDKMLKQYGKTRECRMKNLSSAECFNQITYYECHRNRQDIHPNILKVESNFQELLFSKETKHVYRMNCLDEPFFMRNELLRESTKLLNELVIEKLSKEEVLRLEAIAYQFYKVKVSARAFKCRKLRSMRDEEYKVFRQAIKRLL